MRQVILDNVAMTTTWKAITLPENLSATEFTICMENGTAFRVSKTDDDSTGFFPIREDQPGITLIGYVPKGGNLCYAKVDSATDTACIVVTM